jgi:hexosaminidase
MSWRGVDGAIAAARAGHDAVLAAWPTLYLDNRQSANPNEPPGRGRIVSVEDVYRFDVTPEGMTADELAHVLGVQANLWTEHVRTEERVWRMAFPRAAAVAELSWSAPGRISWESFAARLPAQMARYAALDLPAPPPPAPPLDPRRRASRELETCADKLTLALEDDAPVAGEPAVLLIDIMQPCWIWRGADLTGVRRLAAAVGQIPFNFQIGDDIHAITFRPPATPEGELEVRLGCEGELIAVLPLAPAAASPAVTTLPPVEIPSLEGEHDLCFTFTAHGVDPMSAIDWIALEP